MTFGPIGNTGGLSGSQNDAASHLRRANADQKAQRAEGLGATDRDAETSERDADGRRLWEIDKQRDEEDSSDESQTESSPNRKSRDVSGDSGGLLDLTG